VANIALALCGACLIAWRWQAARRGESALAPFRGRSPLGGPIGAFVLLSVASALFSTLPSRSLPQVKGLGTFALIAVTPALLRKREDVAALVGLWRITALYLVARGILEWLAGSNTTGSRITGGLSVYMTYAELLMTFTLLFAALALDRAREARARALDGALACLAATGVALSLTRSAYLGVLVGIALVFAAMRPRLLLAIPAAALVLAVVVPASVRSRVASSFDANDPSRSDRLLMWRAGAAMIADRPLFGLGPKRVKDLYPVYRRPGYVLPNPGHLHNNAITIAAETGVPSALAYLAFVAAFFVQSARRLRATRDGFTRAVTAGAIGVMAALFVSGFFECNFGDVEVLIATLVVASLPFALPAPDEAAAPVAEAAPSARIETHAVS
jgi:O-antigen ligase